MSATAESPAHHGWCLDLRLSDPRGTIETHIEPLAEYSHISTELSTIRGIALTSELAIDVNALPAGVDPDELVSDICLLLSVARGTRIQWLYRRDEDLDGSELSATYRSQLTRPYQGFEPLVIGDEMSICGTERFRNLVGFDAPNFLANSLVVAQAHGTDAAGNPQYALHFVLLVDRLAKAIDSESDHVEPIADGRDASLLAPGSRAIRPLASLGPGRLRFHSYTVSFGVGIFEPVR